MFPRRMGINDDQALMLVTMVCITALVIIGLAVLAFVPTAQGEVVIPLVSVGVTALASFARQPSFPVLPSSGTPLEDNSPPKAKPAAPGDPRSVQSGDEVIITAVDEPPENP